MTTDQHRSAWSHGRRLLTAGLVLMITGIGFEGLAVPTVLPAALEELRGLALYGWAFSGFWLSNLVGIVLAGSAADRGGPRIPFMAGVAAFAVGLVVAGVAPSMEVVVVGRVVQGFGAGAISAITYVAVARGYDRAAQPRMIAVISSAWVLPGLIGPALAGFVAEAFSWRWAFLGLAPLLPLAAVALSAPLRGLGRPSRSGAAAPARRGRALDAIQLALGAGGVLTALSLRSVIVAVLLAAIGVALALGPLRRLLPAGTLTARPGRGATIAVLALVSVAFFGVEAFIPLAVASVRNAGTVAGGLALTTAAVTWAAGSWIQARLAARASRRRLTIAGLALIALGIGVEAAVPLSSLPATLVAAAGWAVAGLGMGIAYSTATLAAIESAEAGSEGATSASVQLANTIGIAIGTGAAGAMVALAAESPLGLAPGIVVAYLAMTAVLVVAFAVARRMPDAAGAGGTLASAGTERGPALIP